MAALDDESPVKCIRREDNESYFEPVKLVFKGEDGPISYHLICRFYQFDKQRGQLLTGRAGRWYEGNVTLAARNDACNSWTYGQRCFQRPETQPLRV